MNQPGESEFYFHLAGPMLAPGSTIQPGNWGRVIRLTGWRHPEAIKEMALEQTRREFFPDRPSRLDCSFLVLTIEEARDYRARIPGFTYHLLYRVRLQDPTARRHITDSTLSGPQGSLHDHWPDHYWKDFDPSTISMPGFPNWQAA